MKQKVEGIDVYKVLISEFEVKGIVVDFCFGLVMQLVGLSLFLL